jgi:hypothetical protein
MPRSKSKEQYHLESQMSDNQKIQIGTEVLKGQQIPSKKVSGMSLNKWQASGIEVMA